MVLVCFARESVVWAGLGGDGFSLLLAASAEMAQLGLEDRSYRGENDIKNFINI